MEAATPLAPHIFNACCLRPWVDHLLSALRYVMFSGLLDDVTFSHNAQSWAKRIEHFLKVIHHETPGTKNDVYHFLDLNMQM